MKLLLVEDCREVAEVIFEYFEADGVELDYAATGVQGLSLAMAGEFDCIILDVMLPGMDGLSLCRRLRELGLNTPIVMLTARDTNQDMLTGLRQGADDYVVKPFDLELLEARIQAVVRRSSGSGFSNRLEIGPLSLDLAARQVWREQQEITLTPSCFHILRLMAEKYPGVASREHIEAALWPDELPDQDVLRKHIYQLRQKVDKPFGRDIIRTVPKLGYKLEVNDGS